MTERGDWTWKIEHGFGHGRWWWWRWWTRRDDEKTHGQKVPRRKIEIELNCCNEAIPRSLDHVLLSNSVPAGELELFIGHYLVFLAFLAPSVDMSNNSKKRLSFASSSPPPRVHAYLLRSIQFVIICFYHSLASLFSVCFIVKCL